MRAVGSKATGAELLVRSFIRQTGHHMRFNVKSLPGSPDIAVHGLRLAVMVHGCFWHGHKCRRGARVPKANRDYWTAKIARNRRRDSETRRELRKAGWSVVTIWECEVKDSRILARKLKALRQA